MRAALKMPVSRMIFSCRCKALILMLIYCQRRPFAQFSVTTPDMQKVARFSERHAECASVLLTHIRTKQKNGAAASARQVHLSV